LLAKRLLGQGGRRELNELFPKIFFFIIYITNLQQPFLPLLMLEHTITAGNKISFFRSYDEFVEIVCVFLVVWSDNWQTDVGNRNTTHCNVAELLKIRSGINGIISVCFQNGEMLLFCPIFLRLVVEIDITKFLLIQNFVMNCLANNVMNDIFEPAHIDK
jgi:hypothetical protein